MIREAFEKHFGFAPDAAVRAPGRVNLIGEHTDYNDGFVLPVAIDFQVVMAVRPRAGRQVRLYSANFERESAFSLDNIAPDRHEKWSDYVRGVALYLLEAGFSLGGMDAAIYGDVPIGSGLSSSAALEVAAATAFERLNGFRMDGAQKAKLCQKAENAFVGMNCGIMDQFISCLGQAEHALLIDCRSLGYEQVPLDLGGYRIVIGDTGKRRGLVDSEYNARRKECEEAAAFFAGLYPRVRALRDVTYEQYAKHADSLPSTVRKRAGHVVSENERVLRAVSALREGDLGAFGRLMDESHESLRDLYEVSCPELDVMVELARAVPGVPGSRMTGAGFGGCTVSLVSAESLDHFQKEVAAAYRARTGLEPKFYVCRACDGAGPIE
ncbi:MAG: galactokinase [Armatimonadetes bacterium]|nr:galactokinase [Armatimonadota bacterium]